MLLISSKGGIIDHSGRTGLAHVLVALQVVDGHHCVRVRHLQTNIIMVVNMELDRQPGETTVLTNNILWAACTLRAPLLQKLARRITALACLKGRTSSDFLYCNRRRGGARRSSSSQRC